MRLYHKKHGYKFIDGADLDKLLAQGYVNAPYDFEPEEEQEEVKDVDIAVEILTGQHNQSVRNTEWIVNVPDHVEVKPVKKGFVDKVIKLVKGGLNA